MRSIMLCIVLIIELSLAGCVTILPPRKDDDGSTSISAVDSSKIHRYTGAVKYQGYTEQQQLDFEYITAPDIKNAMSGYDHTLVEISASWCAHCWVNLRGLN